MSHLNMPRWQLVWYGWSRTSAFRFGKQVMSGGLAGVYEYRLMIGPLDIRRWARRAPSQGNAQ
jgi:hypothetical protein